MSFPIDAVITWVDGSDPQHAAKMRKYGKAVSFEEDDVAGATRFASIGEISWCVASIRRFAPFVRTIYIITDNQDPHIPDGGIPVRIIDHKEIFKGYGEFLPVFNSISIETMSWRIPGLAEHFIEFNDDFLICAPVNPDDFFTPEGIPVCRASIRSVPWTRFTRAIKRKENGHRKVTFKGTMLNSADMAGQKWHYLKMDHTPKPLLKSFFEQWYNVHRESLISNISFRFRDASQYSCEELHYLELQKSDKLIVLPVHDVLFYLEPKKKKEYILKKMQKLMAGNYKFCCFNSIDKASAEDLRLITDWINEKIFA